MPKRNLGNLISVSFVGRLLGNALQYSIYLVIGRTLGADALGLFTFGFVVLNIGSLFAKVGLDKAVRKFVPIHREAEDEGALAGTLVFSLVLPFCLGTAFAIALYLGSDVVEQYFAGSFGATTVLFLAGIPFLAVMTVGRAATTGFMQTKYAVYIKDIGQSGSAIALVVIGSIVIGTAEATVIGYVLSLVAASVLTLYFLYTMGGFSGIKKIKFDARRMLIYSLPLTIAAVSQYLISWTDVLMLGAFGTPAGLGRYQAAYQTAVILGFLLGAANSIFPSVASDLYQKGEMERLREMYAALTKWLTYFTTLGFIFVLVNASEILSLFGNEFTQAGLILSILAGVFTLTTAVGPAGFLLMMADYERLEMANTIVAAVANIVLNFVLIQEFGVLGAAIATGVSMVLVNLLRLGETWHFLGVRPRIGGYWRGGFAMIIATPMLLMKAYLPTFGLLSTFITGALSLLTFLITSYYLGIDKQDRRLIEEIS